MSENAYGGYENSENVNIKRMIGYYGFDDFKSYNYAKNHEASGEKITTGSNNSAFTVGHDKLKIGKTTYIVLVVVARGTTSKAETVGDLNLFDITKKLNGYEVRKNDYDFYSEISKGVEDYVKNHSAVSKAAKKGRLKVLVTGHSLGGAAANLYAAHLNKEASKSGSSWKRHLDKDSIYAYTFGAIKVFMDNANVEFGYENIHNVYNYYDSFGPHGSKEWLHVSDPQAKFGHTDMFNIGKIEEGSNLLDAVHNHDMSRYIEALKAKGVSCSGKQAFKVVFKPNKGAGLMAPQIITRNKTTKLQASTYLRSGYKFAGWNTKANGKGKAYADKAKVKNLAKAGKTVTLYAQWKKAKEPAYAKVSTASMMNSATFNGVRYWLESYSLNGGSAYRINATKNGSSNALASNVSPLFLTNGHYLFYSARMGVRQSVKEIGWSLEKCSVYRLDLNTGKKKKLASGPELSTFDCDGRYLYYGPYKGLVGADLYALDLKTQKKKFMVKGVKNATYSNGYVITAPHHNVGVNLPIYSFKAGGKSKKKIANAMEVRVIKKRVYYIVINEKNYPNGYRKYSCSLVGKNKKAITGWDTLPNVSFSHDLSKP